MLAADDDRDRVRSRLQGGLDVIDVEWRGAAVSGLIRVELDPVGRSAAAAVVVDHADGAPVAMVAGDLALPATGFELRGPGVWLELMCEVPLDHWTVGLEAFGVTVEDHLDIRADTRGDVTALGLDLDLDTIEPGPAENDHGLRIPVRVHGEVLIGIEGLEIDETGVRWRGDSGVPADSVRWPIRDRLEMGSG